MIVPVWATRPHRRERFDSDMVFFWLPGNPKSPRRGASPREVVPEGVTPFCHPSGGSVSELCRGGQGPSFSNADPAPTLSQLSPLFRGRRPAQLGCTMREETSQAGNRARKTCRSCRRGEHAGELGVGQPEVLRSWDRRALLVYLSLYHFTLNNLFVICETRTCSVHGETSPQTLFMINR